MSLTELVGLWGFENKTRILELIKKNTVKLEGIGQEQLEPVPEVRSTEDPSMILRIVDSGAGNDFVTALKELISENIEIPAASGLTRDNLAAFAGFRGQKLLRIPGISVGLLVLGMVIGLLMHQSFDQTLVTEWQLFKRLGAFQKHHLEKGLTLMRQLAPAVPGIFYLSICNSLPRAGLDHMFTMTAADCEERLVSGYPWRISI